MYVPDIVVYHNPCSDGTTAAAVVKRFYDEKSPNSEIEFFPGDYGRVDLKDIMNLFAGKHVLLVDFSYKRDVINKLSQIVKSLVIIDHHVTAESALKDFIVGKQPDFEDLESAIEESGPVVAYFDMEECGSSMAWKCFYLNGDYEYNAYIVYTKDNDLGRWILPDTLDFKFYQRSLNTKDITGAIYEIDRANNQASTKKVMSDIFEKGRIIKNYVNNRVNFILENETRFGKLDSITEKFPYCITDYMICSDVATAYLEKEGYDIGIAFYFTKNGLGASIRSTDLIRADIVAQAFGGGGHKKAAGFNIPWNELPEYLSIMTDQGIYLLNE
jgi:nanoRNase/pAp phosphatase (c-di-AMP/oligoRNAs hydrolase)